MARGPRGEGTGAPPEMNGSSAGVPSVEAARSGEYSAAVLAQIDMATADDKFWGAKTLPYNRGVALKSLVRRFLKGESVKLGAYPVEILKGQRKAIGDIVNGIVETIKAEAKAAASSVSTPPEVPSGPEKDKEEDEVTEPLVKPAPPTDRESTTARVEPVRADGEPSKKDDKDKVEKDKKKTGGGPTAPSPEPAPELDGEEEFIQYRVSKDKFWNDGVDKATREKVLREVIRARKDGRRVKAILAPYMSESQLRDFQNFSLPLIDQAVGYVDGSEDDGSEKERFIEWVAADDSWWQDEVSGETRAQVMREVIDMVRDGKEIRLFLQNFMRADQLNRFRDELLPRIEQAELGAEVDEKDEKEETRETAGQLRDRILQSPNIWRLDAKPEERAVALEKLAAGGSVDDPEINKLLVGRKGKNQTKELLKDALAALADLVAAEGGKKDTKSEEGERWGGLRPPTPDVRPIAPGGPEDRGEPLPSEDELGTYDDVLADLDKRLDSDLGIYDKELAALNASKDPDSAERKRKSFEVETGMLIVEAAQADGWRERYDDDERERVLRDFLAGKVSMEQMQSYFETPQDCQSVLSILWRRSETGPAQPDVDAAAPQEDATSPDFAADAAKLNAEIEAKERKEMKALLDEWDDALQIYEAAQKKEIAVTELGALANLEAIARRIAAALVASEYLRTVVPKEIQEKIQEYIRGFDADKAERDAQMDDFVTEDGDEDEDNETQDAYLNTDEEDNDSTPIVQPTPASDPEPQAKPGFFGRVWGRFKRQFTAEVAPESEQSETKVGKLGLAARVAVRIAGNVTGVNFAWDGLRFAAQSIFVSRERTKLTEALQKGTAEEARKAVVDSKHLTAEHKQRLLDRIEAINRQFEEKITELQAKRDQYSNNAYESFRRTFEREQDRLQSEAVDAFVQKTVSGQTVLRQAMNTALTATAVATGGWGYLAARPLIFAGMKLMDRHARVTMERGRGDREQRKEDEGLMKDLVLDGFKEFGQALGGGDGKTDRERQLNKYRAYGTLASIAGMGVMAGYGEEIHEFAQEHLNDLLAAWEGRSGGSSNLGETPDAYADLYPQEGGEEAVSDVSDLTGETDIPVPVLEGGGSVVQLDTIDGMPVVPVMNDLAQLERYATIGRGDGFIAVLARQIEHLDRDQLKEMGMPDTLKSQGAIKAWASKEAERLLREQDRRDGTDLMHTWLSTESRGKALVLTLDGNNQYHAVFADLHGGAQLHDAGELTMAPIPPKVVETDSDPDGQLNSLDQDPNQPGPRRWQWAAENQAEEGGVTTQDKDRLGDRMQDWFEDRRITHGDATNPADVRAAVDFAPGYDDREQTLFVNEIAGRNREIQAYETMKKEIRRATISSDHSTENLFQTTRALDRLRKDTEQNLKVLVNQLEDPSQTVTRHDLVRETPITQEDAMVLALARFKREYKDLNLPLEDGEWKKLQDDLLEKARRSRT